MAKLEREFGVPIPGEILPELGWARTAIKKLPPPGPLDVVAMFGRPGAVVLDIGCGNGRYTLHSALLRPDVLHLASDSLPLVIRYATRRANQRGLSNTRFAVIGGRELLRDYIAPATIAEIHVYHPQPYYERREIHKRLVTPEFMALAHRSLEADGLLIVQTDNPHYARYLRTALPEFFEVEWRMEPWPDAPAGRTRREILARQMGLPIFRGVCRPRGDRDAEALAKLVETVPFPTFNADRKLAKYDAMERESMGGPAKPQARPVKKATRKKP